MVNVGTITVDVETPEMESAIKKGVYHALREMAKNPRPFEVRIPKQSGEGAVSTYGTEVSLGGVVAKNVASVKIEAQAGGAWELTIVAHIDPVKDVQYIEEG